MSHEENYLDKMMSKLGIVSRMFARSFLGKEVGERVETVENFSKRFGVGRGTVQTALKFLADAGALSLEAKGHMGTFIKTIDTKKLLQISGLSNITGSMPLPYSLRYEGLATGLYNLFTENNITLSIAYVRGSTNRLFQLEEGKTDFTIVSNQAAHDIVAKNDHYVIIKELSDYTYVGKRALIFKDQNATCIRDHMRVAIDESSFDQANMTRLLCQDLDVTYVPISYNQIFFLLENNQIDVAVWNGDEMEEKDSNVNLVYLGDTVINDTRATLVGLTKNQEINKLVSNIVESQQIEQIQTKVMNKELIPNY